MLTTMVQFPAYSYLIPIPSPSATFASKSISNTNFIGPFWKWHISHPIEQECCFNLPIWHVKMCHSWKKMVSKMCKLKHIPPSILAYITESSPHSKPDPEDGSTDLLECPPDQPLSLCKTDPCDVNTCPVYPNARCKAHFCGGCHARFFDGDDEVTGSCGKCPCILITVTVGVHIHLTILCNLITNLSLTPSYLPPPPPPPPLPLLIDPCALTDCAPGHLCEVYKPTGEAVCEPYCDLDNGGCPPDQLCQLTQPQCIRAPCPPLVECVGGEGP